MWTRMTRWQPGPFCCAVVLRQNVKRPIVGCFHRPRVMMSGQLVEVSGGLERPIVSRSWHSGHRSVSANSSNCSPALDAITPCKTQQCVARCAPAPAPKRLVRSAAQSAAQPPPRTPQNQHKLNFTTQISQQHTQN